MLQNIPMNRSRGDQFLPAHNRRIFVLTTGAILLLLFFTLLPSNAPDVPAKTLRLVVFWVLFGAWSINVLADRFKPRWLHGVVSLMLLGGAFWTLLYYGGAQLGNLRHIFFNMEVINNQ